MGRVAGESQLQARKQWSARQGNVKELPDCSVKNGLKEAEHRAFFYCHKAVHLFQDFPASSKSSQGTAYLSETELLSGFPAAITLG